LSEDLFLVCPQLLSFLAFVGYTLLIAPGRAGGKGGELTSGQEAEIHSLVMINKLFG
jgi:hypothetical protein